MNLFTLDSTFTKTFSIDAFESVIWTERYSDAGDVSLVVPATPTMVNRLALNTFLGLDDGADTMMIDTQSIDEGLLTVTGSSITKFLDQRVYRPSSLQYTTSQTWNYAVAQTILSLVSWVCAPGTDPASVGLSPNDIFSNLNFQNQDPSNDPTVIEVSSGPLFSLIQQIASTYGKGIRLEMFAENQGVPYGLFVVYLGVDRTSGQTVNPIVRFSPDTKSLVDTTELYSNAAYKNVCYAYASSMPDTVSISDVDTALRPRMGFAALDTTAQNSTKFDRRVLMVDDSDFNIDNYAVTDITTMQNQIAADLDTYARNQLANNTFTKTVDGTVVPQSQYQYITDYFLGDIIELQGASGLIQNARITEYIRSQDTTGEKAYPTVAVID